MFGLIDKAKKLLRSFKLSGKNSTQRSRLADDVSSDNSSVQKIEMSPIEVELLLIQKKRIKPTTETRKVFQIRHKAIMFAETASSLFGSELKRHSTSISGMLIGKILSERLRFATLTLFPEEIASEILKTKEEDPFFIAHLPTCPFIDFPDPKPLEQCNADSNLAAAGKCINIAISMLPKSAAITIMDGINLLDEAGIPFVIEQDNNEKAVAYIVTEKFFDERDRLERIGEDIKNVATSLGDSSVKFSDFLEAYETWAQLSSKQEAYFKDTRASENYDMVPAGINYELARKLNEPLAQAALDVVSSDAFAKVGAEKQKNLKETIGLYMKDAWIAPRATPATPAAPSHMLVL